jgi:hypothetical protein
VAIVHDLVTDIDRRAVFFERALDDLDGAFDARAEASWLGQHYPHEIASPRAASRSEPRLAHTRIDYMNAQHR